MPIRVHELPEVYQSVTRRVAIDVIKQIRRMTGIDENTGLYFKGDGTQVPTMINKEINNNLTDDIQFNQKKRIEIELKEEFIGEELQNYEHNFGEYPHYFWDKPLDIWATVNYIRTRMTINFRFQTEDRQDADQFRNEFARHTQDSRQILVHEIGYIVVLPDWDIAFLKHAHNLREAVAGYGDDFHDWLAEKSDDKISYLTQMDGRNGSWTIQERQVDLFGWMEDHNPPETDKGDMGSNRIIEFSYIVEYDKPLSTTLHYPISIHNQLIDKVFRPVPVVYQNHRPALKSISQFNADNIRQFNMRQKEVTHHRYNYSDLRLPAYDPWEPETRPRNTDDLATLLIQIDEESPRYVLSLSDLFDKMTWSPELIRYCRLFHMFLSNPLESPIHFILYSGNRSIDYEELYVTDDLKIYTKRDMNLRTQYHLRMGILHDLMLMSEKCFNRLLTNPWFTDQLLGYLYPNYDPSQIRRTGGALTVGKNEFMEYDPILKLAYYDKFRVRFRDLSDLSEEELKQFLLRHQGYYGDDIKKSLKDWLNDYGENLDKILEQDWINSYNNLSDKEREVIIGKMDRTDLINTIKENRRGELRPEGYREVWGDWHCALISVTTTNGEKTYRSGKGI